MILPAGESRYYATIHSSSIRKPVLFMLHGFMGSGKVFEHLTDPLKKRFTPVTVDLAGHGKTTTKPDASNYSVDVQTAQLKSVFDRFRCDKFFLYGYSMGGRLALQFATRYPEVISGLCIESSHDGIQNSTERAERKQADDANAELIEKDYKRFISRWAALPLFASTPERFKEKYHRISESQDPLSMAASLRGFGSGVMPGIGEEVKSLKIPVHYLAGEADKKYVSIMQDMHERTPHSVLTKAREAGHRIHTDQPGILLETLFGMWERSGGREISGSEAGGETGGSDASTNKSI